MSRETIRHARLYLAGPMRGLPLCNFPVFDEAQQTLEENGHVVASPAQHDREVLGFDPERDSLDDFDFAAAFTWDMRQVCECDSIVLLPGWEQSSGAQIEYRLARLLNKDICTYADGYLQPLAAGDAEFLKVLDVLGALHAKKATDYGTDTDPYANVRASQDWGLRPWVGALARAGDKMQRLKQYAIRGTLANESAEDSMMDLAVYAIIALRLYREESG